MLKLKGQGLVDASEGSNAGQPAPLDRVEYVSLSTLNGLVAPVHAGINLSLNSAMYVIRCRDTLVTLRILALLLLASLLGRLVDGVTLFALCCVAALSMPRLYLANKAKVDQQLEKMQRVSQALWTVLRSKATASGAKKKSE